VAVLRIAKMGNPVFESRRVVVYRIIASRIPEGSGLEPLFIDLVERWPGRARWF